MRNPGEDAGAFVIRLIEPDAGLARVFVRAMAGDALFAEQGTHVPLKVRNFGPEGHPAKDKRQPSHELELIAWAR
jgi:hypothetical protein